MHIFFVLLILSASMSLSGAVYGVDVNEPGSSEGFKCLKSKGYEFAIIRAYRNFNYGVPDTNAPSNIRNAYAAGFKHIDVYMFPWYENSARAALEQVQELQSSLREVDSLYQTIWIDVEGPVKWWSTDKELTLRFIKNVYRYALSHLKNHNVGIYSSQRNWRRLVGDSDYFSKLGVPVWYAHFDKAANFNDWSRYGFGGWDTPNIKQYQQNVNMCGIEGIDKNWHP